MQGSHFIALSRRLSVAILCATVLATAWLGMPQTVQAQQDQAPEDEDRTAEEISSEKLDAQSGIEIDVVARARRTLLPLGVPPTLSGDDADEAAAEVERWLQANLGLTGFFEVMDEGFFFDPSEEGMSVSQINFSNWLNVGAQALIKSRVDTVAEGLRLDLRLYSVGEGSRINIDWSPTTVDDEESIRQEVNRFINAVVAHFTGEPGVLGTRIAYAQRISNNVKHIFVMDVDGANRTRVSQDNNIHLVPSFGANGDIYFTNFRDNNPDLFVSRGGAIERLSRTQGQNSGVSYCDGKAAVTMSGGSSQTDIYLIDPQTGEVEDQLTNTWSIDVSPTFSPDCSQIAFVSSRSGGAHIFVMDADGGNQQRLTFQGTFNTTPDWSPAGDRIVFSGRDERMQYDLFTVDLDNNIERLTQDQGNNYEPAYSPDGRYIVFASDRSGARRLWLMTGDGLVQQELTPEGSGYTEPAWER